MGSSPKKKGNGLKFGRNYT